jgi:hypothetical protein
MTISLECRNRLVFGVMLLGTLGGVASIVLIVLGETKIGGIMTLSWIPATVGCLEWRCRERALHPKITGIPNLPAPQDRPKGGDTGLVSLEALPSPLDIRINIPTNSPRSK